MFVCSVLVYIIWFIIIDFFCPPVCPSDSFTIYGWFFYCNPYISSSYSVSIILYCLVSSSCAFFSFSFIFLSSFSFHIPNPILSYNNWGLITLLIFFKIECCDFILCCHVIYSFNNQFFWLVYQWILFWWWVVQI